MKKSFGENRLENGKNWENRKNSAFADCGKRKFFETVAKTKRRGEFRWRDWDRATAGLGTACRLARIFWFLESWKEFSHDWLGSLFSWICRIG